MMRRCAWLVWLFAVVPFGSAGSAQGVEGIEVMPGRMSGAHPGITTVYRYYDSGFPEFEGLQQYPAAFLHGVGDVTNTGRRKTASRCEIRTMRVRYQDEDGVTSDGFELVGRPEGTSAGTADVNTEFFTQQVPGAPSTTAGPVGFLTTVQVMKGGNASAMPVPAQKSFFFGVRLPVATSWPSSDGLSLAVSYYDKVAIPLLEYDWPKGGNAADPMAYVVAKKTGHRPQPKFSFGYSLIPDAPTLQAGAYHEAGKSRHGTDRGFGTAGFWPEIDATTPRGKQSHDGLSLRLSDGRFQTSGAYLLFFSFGSLAALNQNPIALTGIHGSIYLAPPILTLQAGNLTSTDQVLDLAVPKFLPASLLGFRAWFQAAATVGADTHITNPVSVDYR